MLLYYFSIQIKKKLCFYISWVEDSIQKILKNVLLLLRPDPDAI